MVNESDSPIRPTDDQARRMTRDLIAMAQHGALAVLDPDTGHPVVSRIAVARDTRGRPMTLISTLSQHTKALLADPRCSLLIGEPGPRGDPLTHPRLTLQCQAELVDRASKDHAELRAVHLAQQPKAKLYIDFGDFRIAMLRTRRAFLNGGFGKAYELSPGDIWPE